MNKFEYTVEDFMLDCYGFNDVAGKSQDTSHRALCEQFKLCVEELKETGDGLSTNNPEEVLDGTIDLLVVAFGLLQKLQNMGFDVTKAMRKTSENNWSKFPATEAIAIESAEMYDRQGIDVEAQYNAEYDLFVIKDANDKVRKPSNFVSNDLKDCLPEELKTAFKDWKAFPYKLELVNGIS